MRTEARVFGVITGLLLVAVVVYGCWTAASSGGLEVTGTIVFGLSSVLSGMCAGYFWLVSRRIGPRPEDRPDAEIADGVGVLGFFAPSSFWQVGIAVAVGMCGVGVAMSQWWLLGVGVVALLGASAGLVWEFYVGSPRSE